MASNPSDTHLPTYFIPHGGGPCFFMDWTLGPADTWDATGAFLKGLLADAGARPRAVLVVSAHWEEADFAVNTGARPPLLYDYYGFPEHTYRLQHPAAGAPALAPRVRSLLGAAGLETSEDATRGFDHGVFVPFKLIDPEAALPILQLSLRHDLDPAAHLRAGAALAPLRDEGVLIVGSGMSFHNLRAMFGRGALDASRRFDDWLTAAVTDPSAGARGDALRDWAQAPEARVAHPREEHLLPLMVVAGAAGPDRGRKIFEDEVMGAVVSAFRFG